MKNEGLARVLAVLFPGLGHVYLGDWIRGIAMMAIWVWLAWFVALPKLLMLASGSANFGSVLAYFILPIAIFVISILGVSSELKVIANKQKEMTESL